LHFAIYFIVAIDERVSNMNVEQRLAISLDVCYS